MVDSEKGEGPELTKKFGVRGFPTFVMVNTSGSESDRWMGYETAAEWVKTVNEARSDTRSVADKQEAFAAGPTLPLARSLSRQKLSSGEYVDAVRYLSAASQLDRDPAAKQRYEAAMFEAMARGMKGGDYTAAQVTRQADRVVDEPGVTGDTLLDVAYGMGHVARISQDMTLYEPYLAKAFAATEGTSDEGQQKFRDHLMPDYLMYVKHDTDAAVVAKKASLSEGWQENSKELNNFAWWCYENRVNLEEAEEYALKGVRLAATDAERANVLDTAAEICNARGDCTKAVELIREAVELNPEREYFREQLTRFEAISAEHG